MTKYLNKEAFSSPANNKKYNDNYDRIFGKKEVALDNEDCVHCLGQLGNHASTLREAAEDCPVHSKLVPLSKHYGGANL